MKLGDVWFINVCYVHVLVAVGVKLRDTRFSSSYDSCAHLLDCRSKPE